jgi:molybdopterin-guanine dinucleotide biosynthesis protein A
MCSDDVFVTAEAVAHADEYAGTLVITPGSEGPGSCENKIFRGCHILLVDVEHCGSGSIAALDIRNENFAGFGRVCQDDAVMAELIEHSIFNPRISAAVLAGGKSSRLGRNKALLPLHGKTVIEKVINEALCCVGVVTIITNSAEDYAHFGYPCRSDVLPGGGPLSGIHAALTHCDTEYVLVVSCDIPLVNRELFQKLITALPGHDIVIYKHKHFEPLCALYRRTCLPALEDLIAHGEYRIIDLFPTLRVKVLRIGSADVFKNINTEADYEFVRNA